MNQLVSYQTAGSIAKVTMDEGKVNVMSPGMLKALHNAFDQAEREKAIVVLTGREEIFSAGSISRSLQRANRRISTA